MSRAVRDVAICREALARLPELALSELRQQWRILYKFDASPHLSRELLLLAVAYRMQEVAFGGLRPEHQRQLRQFAQQFKETGEIRRRPSQTFATRGIEAAKLEVFYGVRSKGRHHTGRCHGAATSTEAILGDG